MPSPSPSPLPTSVETSRVLKRARDEEVVESSKRNRQSELQTSPEYPSEFASRYPDALLEHTPRSSSSPSPVQCAYPTTLDTRLQNTQWVDTGHGTSQNGVYSPSPIYGNFDGQYGLADASQPPPVSQLSYGYPDHTYQYHGNEQSAPTMQAMYAPGLPVPQAPHNHERHYVLHPSVAASTPPQEQPIEERLFSALTAAGYGQDVYSSITAEQTAWEKLCAEQNQWLIKAEADLQGRAIKVIPSIHIKQGALGDPAGTKDDLIPSEVWSLRSLSPSLRYAAYRMMTEEAREMVKYNQASKEYQKRWTNIDNFRAFLMQKERAWVRFFDQITVTARRAFWDQKVKEQAVETPVNQAMIDDFERSKIEAHAKSLLSVAVDNETPQSLTAEAAPKKTTQKVQNPAFQPDAAPILPVKPPKPDTIRHPLDNIAVLKYPFDDIEDFTPSENGIYKCMHSRWTGKDCCKFGLDRDRMKQAILRSINTWKSQVEREIEKGNLHPSHMTWPKYQNQALKRGQIAAEEKRSEMKSPSEGGEVELSAKEGKEQKKRKKATSTSAKASQTAKKRQDLQQGLLEDDAISTPSSVPASDSPEQHDTTAPKLSPNQVTTKVAFKWEIARVDMRDKQEFEDCQRREHQKKWPNWSRFEEWWAARLLQVRCLQLSQEQKIVLKRPEPSSIADKDPTFVEKTKEPLPLQVEESADAEENIGLDDSSLDDMFEDDGSDLQET